MTSNFDPYYKWLGIPPRDQPPNHYRLLGLDLFEPDREVIDAAANRVMSYLKTLATGADLENAQRLLNEVAAARQCLLNPQKRAAYDEKLRSTVRRPVIVADSEDEVPPTRTFQPPGAAEDALPEGFPAIQLTPIQVVGVKAEPVKGAPAKQGPAADSSPEGEKPAEDDPAAQKQAAFRKTLILTGGSAGFLLAVIVGILAMAGVFSGKPKAASHGTTAKSAHKSKQSSSRQTARYEEAPSRPVVRPVETPKASEELKGLDDIGDKKAAKPAAAEEPQQSQPGDPAKPNGNAAGKEEPAKTDKPTPPAETAAQPPAETPVAGQQTAAAPAETPVAQKGSKSTKSKPSPKPAGDQPPKPVDFDPESELKKQSKESLALPPIPETFGDASPLADLAPDTKHPVRLKLVGGEDVLGSERKFTIEEKEIPNGRRWPVMMSSPDGDPKPVARFEWLGGKLQFAWEEAGGDKKKADLLRCCYLRIDVGDKYAVRRLSPPQEIEPIPVSGPRGFWAVKDILTEGWPKGPSLDWKVVAISGPSPYAKENPSTSPVGKEKDTFDILLRDDLEKTPILLRINFERPRPGLNKTSIGTKLAIGASGGNKIAKPADFKMIQGFQSEHDKLEASKPLFEAQYKQLVATFARDPARLKQAEDEHTTKSAQGESRLAFLNAVLNLCKGKESGVGVCVSVVANVEGRQVPLIRTKISPPPAEKPQGK